jgi:hypothetical protein
VVILPFMANRNLTPLQDLINTDTNSLNNGEFEICIDGLQNREMAR